MIVVSGWIDSSTFSRFFIRFYKNGGIRVYSLYQKFQEYITKLFMFIVYVFSAVIPVVLFSQVIFRYIFKRPLLGLEEIASASFIWVVIFGSAVLFKEKKHIIVDVAVQHVSPNVKKAAAFLADVIMSVILFVLIRSCFLALPLQKVYKSVVLGIPKRAHTVALMVSLIFMLICTVESIIKALRAKREHTR